MTVESRLDFTCDLMMEMARRTFLHSCAQRLGLQRLSSTIAIRVILSAMMEKSKHNRRCRPHLSIGPALARTFHIGCPAHVAFISVNPVNPIGAYHDLGYSVTTSGTQSILMAKGATSKDKKSGGKGKGKVEETADKGGKVRA